MKCVRIAAAILGLCTITLAGGLTGRYVMNTANGSFQLTLTEQGDGTLTGELAGTTGFRVQLEGQVQDGTGMGVAKGNNLAVYFEVYTNGSGVSLDLIEPDANNMPDYNKTRHLEFQRAGGGNPATPGPSGGGNPLSGGNPAATRQANPLARPKTADPIPGNYSGDGLRLVLTGGSGRYTGTLTFQGQEFPVTATGSAGNVQGSFSSGGQSFPFSARLSGASLTFQTGGTSYTLQKGGTATPATPRNPLQKGGGQAPVGRAPAGAASPSSGDAAGGQVLTDAPSGMSITVPAGWQAKQTPGGYLMGSNQYPGLILVTEHHYQSLQQMAQASGEGFEDDNNQMYLRPSSQPQSIGDNAMSVEMTGSVQGTPAKAYVTGVVSPRGGGLLVIALTSTDAYTPQHRQFAEQIARSARFGTPKADTGLVQWFSGKYYHFSSSSGGGSSFSHESTLSFCPNGTYHDSYEAGGSGTSTDQYGNQTMAYGTAGTERQTARWTIRGNRTQGTITIIYPNGDSRDMTYRVTSDLVYIDGESYARAGVADCR